jgi:cysteine desulfurase
MIDLDANATEPLRPCAREAAIAAMDLAGNPSSIHSSGRQARRTLEAARVQIAALLGGEADGLVFTSGGTEANALAIAGLGHGRRVLCGATEHAAVLESAPDAARIPVDRAGAIDLGALDAMLASGGPALVCIMLANNETGVIAPIAEVSRLCRHHGAHWHVDAVQAAGRMPVNLEKLGADSLAVSGHKVGGPKGAGALLLARGRDIAGPLIAGGGQERGRRGGTPALPAIAGFAAALQEAASSTPAQASLRDAAEAAAVAAGAIVCGAGPRLPQTTCLALPGVRADGQVIALDLAGIAVSAGAACSSGKVARSHVLDAMGLDATCAIRVSLPWNVQAAHITAFASAYASMAARMRRHAA